MEQEVLQFIRRHHLFKDDDHLLLAVSGGLDSMVMLQLLHSLNFNIAVAHCNFGLRGEESDGDAALVESVCGELSIPYHEKKFNTVDYASTEGISVQMAARDLRYHWFYELAKIHGYTRICTAHHANDQAETILLNLTRGTGVTGLKGIPIKNNQLVRPLLHVSREQLEDYATKKNLTWRNDSSNLETEYQRNLIRLEVIPLLKQINPALVQSLSRFAEIMSDTEILMQEQIEQTLSGLSGFDGETVVLQFQTLKEHPACKTILYHFLKTYNFNSEQSASITLALEGNPGKQFYSESHRLIIDRNRLIIEKQNKEAIIDEIPVINGMREATLPGGTLFIEKSEVVTHAMLNNKDANTAFLDAGKIIFPLNCRRWLKGDYFYPLGMNHRRKLSDFFIDQKLSIPEKENTRLLLNGDDIIWIIGQRIDQRYRITEKTTVVLSLHWKTHDPSNAL